jgi:branched-chain amino acid transport system substrate-binding protein
MHLKTYRRSVRRAGALVVAAACAAALAACGSSGNSGTTGDNGSSGQSGGKDPIYLGAALSLTGTFATFEVPAYQGLKVGVDEVNAAGGVLGRKLVLDVQDTGSDASKVPLATQKILSAHNVTFMAPDVVGDLAKQVLQYTSQKKVISMTAGYAAGLGDPKTYPYNFMLYPAPDRQLPAYVAGIQQLAGGDVKLAILTDTESSDIALSDSVQQAVTSAGGKVVSRSEVSNQTNDVTVQVAKAQKAGANVLFVRSVAGVCRAAGDAVSSIKWTSVKVLVATACVNSAVFDAVPSDIAKNYYGMSDEITTRKLGDSSVRPAYADYVKELAKQGDITNLEVSANYTDAVHILAWAITKAGSTDGDKIKSVLESLKSTPLPEGTTVWTVSPGWSADLHDFQGDLTHWWALAQPGEHIEGTYPGVEVTVNE